MNPETGHKNKEDITVHCQKGQWEESQVSVLSTQNVCMSVWSFTRFIALSLVLTVPFAIEVRSNWQRKRTTLSWCEFSRREKSRC